MIALILREASDGMHESNSQLRQICTQSQLSFMVLPGTRHGTHTQANQKSMQTSFRH